MAYTLTRTGAQIEEIHDTVDNLPNIVSNENLISNASFESSGSVTNPPDATPRNYNAGDELFRGMFAVGALTGVTYIDGKANGTGQLYTDVYKSEKQKLSTAAHVASIANINGSPVEIGASFVDIGDYWRVTFDMTNTFSVKFEQGNVATRHEVGTGCDQYTMTLQEATSNPYAIAGDYKEISDRANGKFKYVTGATANGFDIIQHTTIAAIQLKLVITTTLNLEEIGVVTRPFSSSPVVGDFVPSADAFQRALDLTDNTNSPCPELTWSGDFYCEKEVTVPRFGTKIVASGSPHKSRILTFQAIPMAPYITIKHTDSIECKDFSVVNTGSDIGFAFSTPQDNATTSQAGYCEWRNVQAIGFYNSWWLRASLWCNWTGCFSNSLAGIRFARNSNPYDLGLEPKAGGWNIYSPLGWFNNVNLISSCVFEDEEVGVFGAAMGLKLDNVTCQGQTGDSANNVVLPTSEDRTGVFLTSGTEGVRDGWVNNFTGTFYAESCDRPIYLKDQGTVLIESVFSQGGATDDRAETALHLNNSFVKVDSWVGQDWYETALTMENDSTLIGRVGGVATSIPKTIDGTSIHYEKTNQESYKVQYQYTSSASNSKTLPLNLSSRSHYRLNVGSLSNGTSVAYGNYHIYRHTSDATTVVVETTAASSLFNITVVGGKVVVTKTSNVQLDFQIFLEELTESITDVVSI